MTSQPEGPPRSLATLVAKVTALNEIADELAGEFEPSAALESILARCIQLMACDAGSVSSVDEAAGTYRKVADIGVQCQSGQVFPLDEGMTGEVVRRRTAVWFDRYDDVKGGHLDAADRDGLGATIGVPLEWRGRVIGACVLFSRDPHRRFGHDDAQLLGMFARHGAVALANATMHAAIEEHTRHKAATAERQRVLAELEDLLAQAFQEAVHEIDVAEERKPADADGELGSVRAAVQAAFAGITAKVHELAFVAEDQRDLDTLLRSELATLEDIRSLRTELVVSGEPVALEPAVLRDIMRVLREVLDNIVRHASARSVRVLLAYEYSVLRVVVQDDGRGFVTGPSEIPAGPGQARIVSCARELGGDVAFESEPNWGTTVRLRFPQRHRPSEHAPRVPVVVAAPRRITTAGIARLITWEEPSLAVVAECRTVEDLLRKMHRSAPAVTMIAHDDPDLLVDWVRRATDACPDGAIVAVCPRRDYDLLSEVVLAGATGCVLDTADGSTAASVVLAASKGRPIVPTFDPIERGPGHADLTSREREVRHLVERGLANKAIADELVISVKTVEKHVGAILRKAGLKTRNELMARGRAAAR